MLEQDIETGIRTVLTTALVGLFAEAVLIRTFWSEETWVEGDEDIKQNAVTIAASPSSRPSGHEPFRVVTVRIECAAYLLDDRDRRDLAALYNKVRYTVETAVYDFGANVTYTADSYEMPNGGDATIEDGWNLASLSIDFHVCAEAYE